MSERAFNSFVTALIGAVILAGVFALGGCTTLPPGAYGSARMAPVKYAAPARVEDCVRVPFPQCSGGN